MPPPPANRIRLPSSRRVVASLIVRFSPGPRPVTIAGFRGRPSARGGSPSEIHRRAVCWTSGCVRGDAFRRQAARPAKARRPREGSDGSAPEMSRYVIYGAGAVGAVLGGRLALAGREVTLVARGAHAEALAQDGLRLRSKAGETVV